MLETMDALERHLKSVPGFASVVTRWVGTPTPDTAIEVWNFLANDVAKPYVVFEAKGDSGARFDSHTVADLDNFAIHVVAGDVRTAVKLMDAIVDHTDEAKLTTLGRYTFVATRRGGRTIEQTDTETVRATVDYTIEVERPRPGK